MVLEGVRRVVKGSERELGMWPDGPALGSVIPIETVSFAPNPTVSRKGLPDATPWNLAAGLESNTVSFEFDNFEFRTMSS